MEDNKTVNWNIIDWSSLTAGNTNWVRKISLKDGTDNEQVLYQ